MLFPASVIDRSAHVFLIPVSPLLIFGLGPFPHLGIAGGAVAVLIYYFVGCSIFAGYIWSGRGVLKPSQLPPRCPGRRCGKFCASGVLVLRQSLDQYHGDASRPGWPAWSVRPRSPVTAPARGWNICWCRWCSASVRRSARWSAPRSAPDDRERALRVAWIGAAIAGGITEAIGLAAAFCPDAWLSLFGSEPQMLVIGALYLRIVGPFYGLFGGGLALYFACQGAGRLAWPMVAATTRVIIAAAGGWLMLVMFGSTEGLFAAVAFALLVFGAINAIAVASGVWFKQPKLKAMPAARPA